MKALTRAGVAVGTVLLGLGLTAPAHAGSYTYTDKAGDVHVEVCEDATGDCTPKTVTSETNGDVIASSVQHRSRKVVLRTRYRDLSTGRAGLLWGRVKTNEGVDRIVALYLKPDGTSRTSLFRTNGEVVACSMGKTVSWTDNVIEVRIPRSCLSRPRWIRAGQGYWRHEPASDTTTRWWGDDAQSAQPYDSPLLSPRVYRG